MQVGGPSNNVNGDSLRVTFDPAQKRSRECIHGSSQWQAPCRPCLCRMLLVAENKRREGSHHLPPVGMPS